MDVGYYLGELLVQESGVSVPGLGYFVQERMSGYYNEDEGEFHPPYYRLKFDQQENADDVLAVYLAGKKNISLESSKYFIEKYATALKQAALTGEAAVGNLGWLYTNEEQLAFRPADKAVDVSAFYGYPPVKISKAGAIVEPGAQPIDETQPAYPPQPEVTPEPVSAEEPEEQQENASGYNEEFLEEEETRSPLRAIVIALAVIVIIGSALFTLYTYAPTTFERLQFWKHQTQATLPLAEPRINEQPKIDSINTDTAQTALNDSTKAIALVADTTKSRFEVIATSCRKIEEANGYIKNFKSIGIDAKIVADAPGRRIKITVGTYPSRKEAEAAKYKLIAAKQIQKDAYTIEIKPGQQ